MILRTDPAPGIEPFSQMGSEFGRPIVSGTFQDSVKREVTLWKRRQKKERPKRVRIAR